MAQQANLQVASRTTTGKGAARSLRREGKVPGVIYGHGREAESVSVESSATLNKMPVGISAGTTILDLTIDGRAPVKALIREIPRDSLRPSDTLHLDLYQVRSDEEITLEVPIRLIAEARLPSLFEACALPLLEAMAAASPSVAADRHGTKELAEHVVCW